MITIFLKSKDEGTVVSIRGRDPVAPPQRLFDEGYTEIPYKEFRKLRQRIERRAFRTKEPALTVSVTPVEAVDIAVAKAQRRRKNETR